MGGRMPYGHMARKPRNYLYALGLPAFAAGPPQQSGRRSAVTAFTETEYWHSSGPAKRVRHFATERGRSKRVFTTRIRRPLNYVHVLGLPPLPPAPSQQVSHWHALGLPASAAGPPQQSGRRSAVTAFTETEYWHGSGPAKRVRHFATERGRSKRVITTRIRRPPNYVHVLGLPLVPPAPLNREAGEAPLQPS